MIRHDWHYMDEQLLLRYLNKECSDQDLRIIHEWIQLDKANANWLFRIEEIWSLKDQLKYSDEKYIDEAFNELFARIDREAPAPVIVSESISQEESIPAKKSIYLNWLKYAAAAVLVLFTGYQIYLLSSPNTLTLNTIDVPRGQRASVVLSDGTKVWLNAESRFIYPTRFADHERTVSLSGEGYFEVHSNEEDPFIIENPQLQVRVTGTKFNFRAYEHEKTMVSLIEGRVEVSTPGNSHKITMNPNEEIIYSEESGLQHNKNAFTDAAESWTTGELYFREEKLASIVKALQRKYDQDIFITVPDLEDEVFTCRARKSASLQDVLSLLKETRKIDYYFENDQYHIHTFGKKP